jgi:hypothetical protein
VQGHAGPAQIQAHDEATAHARLASRASSIIIEIFIVTQVGKFQTKRDGELTLGKNPGRFCFFHEAWGQCSPGVSLCSTPIQNYLMNRCVNCNTF